MGRQQYTLSLTSVELDEVIRWLEVQTGEPHQVPYTNEMYIYQYYGRGWQAGYVTKVPRTDYYWYHYSDRKHTYLFHIEPTLALLFKMAWGEDIVYTTTGE